MGYTTYFIGMFDITPTLTPEHLEYLTWFSKTRRVKRDAIATAVLPDPVREAVGLPVGIDGGFYIGDTRRNFHDDREIGVTDHNNPPEGQPGLWCQWVPDSVGTSLQWDEVEKFYDYIDWLKYLMAKFLTPWGYALNGTVEWFGEESDDRGMIILEGTDKVRVRYMLADPHSAAVDV